MITTLSEHALARVLAYLRLCEIPLNREVILEALGTVQEALVEDGASEDLLARVMGGLARRFPVPDPRVPVVSPRLQRSSIRYDS
jgi:hypothetical protein